MVVNKGFLLAELHMKLAKLFANQFATKNTNVAQKTIKKHDFIIIIFIPRHRQTKREIHLDKFATLFPQRIIHHLLINKHLIRQWFYFD